MGFDEPAIRELFIAIIKRTHTSRQRFERPYIGTTKALNRPLATSYSLPTYVSLSSSMNTYFAEYRTGLCYREIQLYYAQDHF